MAHGEDKRHGRGIWRLIVGAILLAAGGAELISGVFLIADGGSFYFALAGTAMVATAILLMKHMRAAGPAVALLLFATILWAIQQSGFYLWALAPRLWFAMLAAALCGLALLADRRAGRGLATLSPFAALAIAFAVLGAAAASKGSWIGDEVDVVAEESGAASPDWPYYGADLAGTRFSPLAQLTAKNVANLEVAWRFRFDEDDPYGFQATPLKVGRLLYVCSSSNRVAALDVETGAVEWLFNPEISTTAAPFRACRGVAYFDIGEEEGLCAQRIITNTIDARIIALDAYSGARCPNFGNNGEVSMLEGLGEYPIGYYFFNGAPLVAKGKIIVGGVVVDNQKWGEPSGVIRAIDAKTGALVWAYDVGAPDRIGAPTPGETYTHSTPNSWAQMSYDEELGLVYASTGNATPDYFGAQRRPIDDEITSSVLALDIETGRRRWIFQTVHHDIWDYDIGSQPTLVDIATSAGVERALIQPTKRGELFLLDRSTGAPLAEVEERTAPQAGAVLEERLAPTQPFSVGMPRLNGHELRERDMWGLTPFDEMWCRAEFRKARYEGAMTPPGLTPSITYPGYMGGVDWGAASVDPERDILVVASSNMANYTRLLTRDEAEAAGAYPMGFGREGREALIGVLSQSGTPYGAQTKPFLSPLQAPCNRPPWGKLTAIDLKTRSIIWSRPLGSAKETGPFGIRSRIDIEIGAPLLGGAVVTRGGLIFVGATMDRTFRAVDLGGGKTLWSAPLGESAIATPMTYWSDESERQFVVIAAGGHKALWTPTDDELVAYALPK